MGASEQAPLLMRHRLTVDDYYRMAEVGILAHEARVELIEGEIIDMPRIGTRHASSAMRLMAGAMASVGDLAIVAPGGPLRLDNLSEPVPDLMLLKPREDFYASAHPGAADVLLLIEVSDSSARYDREIKLPLYARHGITEVWIVDLEARMVRFFRGLQDERYTDISATETPGPTPVAALPGVSIDLSRLLG